MTTSLFGLGETINANGTLVTQSFVGLIGQTVFNILGVSYVPNTNTLQVYINGQRQVSGRDFIETNSTSFTLIEGVFAGDNIDIVLFPQLDLEAVPPGAINLGGSYSLAHYVSDSINNAKAYPYLAIGDGVTDDTASIQAWLDDGGGFLPRGLYKVNSLSVDVANTLIWGEGYNSQISTFSPNLDVFAVEALNVTFDNLVITSSVTRTGGYYINANSSTENSNLRIRNCWLYNFYHGIGLIGAGSYSIILSKLVLSTITPGGIGVLYAGVSNWDDCILEDTLINGPAGFLGVGIQIQNIGDLSVRRVKINGCTTGVRINPPSGFGTHYISFTDLTINLCGAQAFLIDPTGTGVVGLSAVAIRNCWIGSTPVAISLSPTNVGVTQRVSIANSTFTAIGDRCIVIGGSTVLDTSIDNNSMFDTLNSSISIVAGSNGVSIRGNTIKNSFRGIALGAGLTPNVIITNNKFETMGLEAILDNAPLSVGKIIANNIGWGYNFAVYDPPNLADGAGVTTTVANVDAILGDTVKVSFSLDLQGIMLFGWVSAAGTVSVRFQNETGGPIDLGSGDIRTTVERIK